MRKSKQTISENWAHNPGVKYKTKLPDMDNLIPVRIDARTTVYVKPGTDIAAIRKKYEYLKLKL